MHPARLLLALLLCACSVEREEPFAAAGPAFRVTLMSDAGSRDSGADAGTPLDARVTPVDGGELDSGPGDAGRDAGPRPDSGVGECNLVLQDCPASRTCRRVDIGGSPSMGAPACQSFGTILEHNYGAPPGTRCRPGDCARGLFCQSFGGCRRFCDPAGAPCPDTLSGAPQTCGMHGPGLDPYCSPGGP